MPPQQGQIDPGFMSQLGNEFVQAVHTHKDTKAVSSARIPPGINGGIARLDYFKIDKFKTGDNTGKYYFMGKATAFLPLEHDGQRVGGRSFNSKLWPLCQTKYQNDVTTFAQNFGEVMNVLKLFGINTSVWTDKDANALERKLIAAIQHLNSKRPFFRWDSWRGKPIASGPNKGKERDTSYNFNGIEGLEKFDPAKALEAAKRTQQSASPVATGVEENPYETATDEPEEDRGTLGYGEGDEGTPESEGVTNGNDYNAINGDTSDAPMDEFGGLDDLVRQASPEGGENRAVQDELEAMAERAGYTKEEVQAAPDWSSIADMVRNPREVQKEAPSTPEPSTNNVPEVGAAVKYYPLDPKTNKPRVRGIACTVTGVNARRKSADLRGADNKTSFSNVPFTEIK